MLSGSGAGGAMWTGRCLRGNTVDGTAALVLIE